MVGSPVKIFAAGVTTSVSGPGSITVGQSFTVKFSLNAGETISAFTARVNYPRDLLTIESKTMPYVRDFNTTSGAITSYSVLKGSNQFLSITFKPTSSFTSGRTATISLTEFVASNEQATERLKANDKSVSVTAVAPKSTNNNLSALSVDGVSVSGFSASKTTYNLGNTDKTSISVAATKQDASASVSGVGTINLAYGLNTIRVVVKAENGASKTYTINITRNDYRSSNNFLKSIELSQGNLQFDKNRNSYTLIVDHAVTKLTVDVTKEDATSFIKNTSITKDLNIYSNIFEFTVVAENNSKRTYTINVVRRDDKGYAGSLNTDNNLKSLTIEGYTFEFSPDKLNYELEVEHAVSELSINAEVANELASLVLPDSFELNLGENIFDIIVIAQDETQKIYQLKVNRARNLPVLSVEELIAQLGSVEADVLNVAVTPNMTIDSDSLAKLKATGKDVAFYLRDGNNLGVGYWRLKSDQLDLINSFNQNVSYLPKIPTSLNKLLNYAQSTVLVFDHEGKFEQPLNYVLPLEGKFDEGFLLNVYYYNEETAKLELVAKNLAITNDEVTWEMDHASIYVITPATFASNFSFNSLFDASNIILIVALALLTLSLLTNLILLLKVRKLTERLFVRKFESYGKPMNDQDMTHDKTRLEDLPQKEND